MNAPLCQCLQSAGLLVPPILHVALKGHKLAMLAAHLHNPGTKSKGTKSKRKKGKKNENKNCPMVSLILPTTLQITPTGV